MIGKDGSGNRRKTFMCFIYQRKDKDIKYMSIIYRALLINNNLRNTSL